MSSACTLWVSSYDIPLPSAQTGPVVSLGFFPWEKPRLPGCTVHCKIMFLNIYPQLCVSLSFYLVQVLWVEQLHGLVLEPVF